MSQQTMPEEGGFLRRWARRKAEAAAGTVPPPEPVAAVSVVPAPLPADTAPADDAAPAEAATPAAPLPTMADVAQLTRDSDFSAFVARGVDADVRRSALKKLFADPHFNNIDRLDVYMDDYTKPSPVSEAMLAGLQHAKSVFRRPEPEEAAVAEVAEVAEEEQVAQVAQDGAAALPAATAADAPAAAIVVAEGAGDRPAPPKGPEEPDEPAAADVGGATRVSAGVPEQCP